MAIGLENLVRAVNNQLIRTALVRTGLPGRVSAGNPDQSSLGREICSLTFGLNVAGYGGRTSSGIINSDILLRRDRLQLTIASWDFDCEHAPGEIQVCIRRSYALAIDSLA